VAVEVWEDSNSVDVVCEEADLLLADILDLEVGAASGIVNHVACYCTDNHAAKMTLVEGVLL